MLYTPQAQWIPLVDEFLSPEYYCRIYYTSTPQELHFMSGAFILVCEHQIPRQCHLYSETCSSSAEVLITAHEFYTEWLELMDREDPSAPQPDN